MSQINWRKRIADRLPPRLLPNTFTPMKRGRSTTKTEAPLLTPPVYAAIPSPPLGPVTFIGESNAVDDMSMLPPVQDAVDAIAEPEEAYADEEEAAAVPEPDEEEPEVSPSEEAYDEDEPQASAEPPDYEH